MVEEKPKKVWCACCHKPITDLSRAVFLFYHFNGFKAYFCGLECLQKWVWQNFLKHKVKIKPVLETS